MAQLNGPRVREQRPFMPRTVTKQMPVGSGKSVDHRIVAQNLGAITRTNFPQEDVSRYNQPYDWRNLLDRYKDRALDLHTEYFTAEMLNENGYPFLSAVAPIFPMVEKHVEITKRELYQLPFDLAAIGGVPRRTGWRQEVRVQSLQHYIRYQSLELNYLMDINFGRQALLETTGLLVSQGRLTLFVQASLAIVSCAIEQSFKRFENDHRTARLIHNDTEFFAIVHANPDDFVKRLISIIDPMRRFNLIIIPEGQGLALKEISEESRTVDGYHFGYDDVTGRVVMATFDAMTAVASYQGIKFIENPNYRYSTKNGDMEPTQTLRSFTTYGECVIQPPIASDGTYNKNMTNLNDPVVHDQTEKRIEHLPLSYAAGLAACGLWNDVSGNMAEKGTMGSATIALAKFYDQDKHRRSEVVDYLQNGLNFDNNTPPPGSYNSTKALDDIEFRKWCPWVTVNEKGNVVPGKYVFDYSERAIPWAYIEKAARSILEMIGSKKKTVTFGAKREALEAVLLREYVPLMPQFFPDGGFEFLEGLASNSEMSEPIKASKKAEEEEEEEGLQGDVVPSASTSSLLSSNIGAFLHSVREGKISLKATLDRALRFVPDSHIETYSEIARVAAIEFQQAQGDPARLAQIQAGMQHFAAHLEQTGGRTTSRKVIDNVQAHVKEGKSFAELPQVALLSVRTKTQEKPIDVSQLTLATGISEVLDSRGTRGKDLDAMDIDESFGQPRFGTIIGGDERTTYLKNSQIFLRRMEFLEGNLEYEPEVAVMMTLIGHAHFSYKNMYTLYKRWGIQLFRLNFYRPCQRYRMLDAVAMVQGPETMVTGLSQPLITPGMQSMEGYINIVAQFFSACIVRDPENFFYIPNAFCDRLLSDINVQFIRSRSELQVIAAHKPSVWAEPVPMDETNYDWPIHIMNKDVASPDDPNGRSPLAKHSGADLMIQFAERGWIQRQNNEMMSGDFYAAAAIALICFRGWSLQLDAGTKRYNSIPGTGARGQMNRNDSTFSASVWSGGSIRFPSQPKCTVPVS